MGTRIHPSQAARVARELEQAVTIDGEFFKIWPVWNDRRKRQGSPDVGPRGRTKRSETYRRELDEQQKRKKDELMKEWKNKESKGIQGSRREERKRKVPLGGGGYESMVENKALEGTREFAFLPSLQGAESSLRVQQRLGLLRDGDEEQEEQDHASKEKAKRDNFQIAEGHHSRTGVGKKLKDGVKARGTAGLKAPIQPGKARNKRTQESRTQEKPEKKPQFKRIEWEATSKKAAASKPLQRS